MTRRPSRSGPDTGRAITRRGATGGHPDWCARDHRCSLGEHRADPIVLDVPGLGRLTLTRVLGRDRRQHAEIRATVALADAEPYARLQLLTLTDDLTAVLGRATRVSPLPRPVR